MKQNRIAAAIAFGLLIPTAPATAWWQWYYQDTPFAPAPGMWFYQNFPQIPVFNQMEPWVWQYQTVPYGATSMWTSRLPTNSLFVEQSQSPAGYSIRVYTEQSGTQDIDVGLDGRSLVIKRRANTQAFHGAPWPVQQSGWTTQWVSLAPDANLGALRISRGADLIEIFVPRARQ